MEDPIDGDKLGSPDGSELGPKDGRVVGAIVTGDAEGLPGVTVGFADGLSVGPAVTGAFVGAAEVGSDDGESEGRSVGIVLNIEVGLTKGDGVGPIAGAVVELITGEIEGDDGIGVISTAETSGDDDDDPAESEPMGATVGDSDSPVTKVTTKSTTLEPSDTDTVTSSLSPSESLGTT